MSKNVLLIPSYCPPDDFPRLVEEFRALGQIDILVVNDGSPAHYDPIFKKIAQQDITILTSGSNSGKGSALKKGYLYLLENNHDFEYVTTCDDDGQHHPEDVMALVRSIHPGRNAYLGTRSFNGNVPLRSRLGNYFMTLLFFLTTRKWIMDTQTGLRCYHRSLLEKLTTTPSSGFNFESVTLMNILAEGEAIVQHPIRTLYFDNNRGTRFKLIPDSYRVVSSLLRFRFLGNHLQ